MVGEGVGEGMGGYSRARGGRITSFNIYIFHVKKFTSKINEEGEGSVNCFLVFYML
jgi:hypothetical protein